MAEELDWTRVAEAVRERRAQLGFKRQEDAAEAAGIGVTTWRQIEGAKQSSYRPVILFSVAATLGWPADALRRIGQGLPPDGEDARSAELEEIRDEVRQIRALVDQILADPPTRRRGREPHGAEP